MREAVKAWKKDAAPNAPIEEIARWINPIVKGWINYYGKFRASELRHTMNDVEVFLIQWCKKKYGKSKGSWKKAIAWLSQIRKREPDLFASWQWFWRNDKNRRAV
jgi:RNA-directed DNA polymerase